MNILHKASFLGLAALASLGLGARPGHADTLVTVDFPGAVSTRAVSINDHGDLVGVYQDSSSNTRGYERHADGTFSAAIVDPNNNSSPNNSYDGSTVYTRALGISNAGVIAGDYFFTENNGIQAYDGYLLSGGSYTTVSAGSTVSTDILGMDGAGDFTGVYGSNSQTNEGFLDVNGALTTFNGPTGNTGTYGMGINSSHVVVGQYVDSAGNNHGFSRDPNSGAITTIDVPNATSTGADGINNAGTIVGFYGDSNGNTHGFLDKGGVFTTFDVPGSQFTTIRGINNEGEIAGVYQDSSGTVHGFIDTPTPPTTHLLWDNTDGRAMFWNVAADGTFTVAGGYGPYTDNGASNLWTATALATGPDGVSHILWNNTDHRVMLWNVHNDGGFTVIGGYGPYTDQTASQLWSAVGLSVGPDNVMHLLWDNTDHRAMFWDVQQDGSFSVKGGYGPYTDNSPQNVWDVAGVSTGPDNVSHLLWSNSDKRAMFWDVSNADGSFSVKGGYGPYTDGGASNLWGALAVSTGPDNVSHLLWNNSDLRAMFWDVSGADGSFSVTGGYGPYTDNAPQNTWSVTGLTTGSDNVSHLLWNNVDHRAMLWDVSNTDGSFTVRAGYGPYTDGAAQNLWSAVGVSAGP